MKVYIGPYESWIGPYQIAEKIFFWIDHRAVLFDTDGILENRWDVKACDKFGEWLSTTWVDGFCNWINTNFNKRKVKVRIDPYDTWSMDHTLALIIHPMLVQLKEKNHGYFHSDAEDAPHIGQDEGTDFTNDPKAIDRYNWIMDEMIWSFNQIANLDGDMEYYSEEKGWDMEGRKKHSDRIENGLRLFGKYYRGLWD
jgi:hypothetical protein